MKHLVFGVLALACLISGCQQDSMTSSRQKKYSDSATIYQEMAWQEMFTDSLMQAETHAYRAFMLSQDSTLEHGALSLLCYIYYREGKQQELQLLMQTLSPDVYMNVMDVQMHHSAPAAWLRCPLVSPSYQDAFPFLPTTYCFRQA